MCPVSHISGYVKLVLILMSNNSYIEPVPTELLLLSIVVGQGLAQLIL